MDLVSACRIFVCVAEHGSFTVGAAAARVPQSVASRRVAALEEHFGQALFDRTARRPALTAFGQDMLGSAKRLVQLAEALDFHAQEAKLRPLTLAVPGTCTTLALARLDAAARDRDIALDLRCADPHARTELLREKQVRAAVAAVPPAEAAWTVPLGLASTRSAARSPARSPVRLESLRPLRADDTYRRIRIQPEDDMPYVRDTLQHAGHRAALLPAQISVADTLVVAAGAALRTRDFLLCSAAQARNLDLAWQPIAGLPLARGYTVAAHLGDDAALVRGPLAASLAAYLGAAHGAAGETTHHTTDGSEPAVA